MNLSPVSSLWHFRGFVIGSVKREFQSRYTGTQLGWFWAIANPLALIITYTLIFIKIMMATLPGKESIYAYSIYLCAGVLTWIFFAEVLGRSVNIFIENANLLKKVLFPKICLPIIVIASASVHFCIVMVIFTLFLLITGSFPGWVVLTIIPLLLIQTAFAIGLGMFLATINVFYRDVQQGTNILVQFWFWFTPIVYVPDALPKQVKSFLEWNPMWPLAISYHRIFVDAQPPQWATLTYPLTFAVVFLLLGVFAFHRLKGEIVDEL